MNRRQLIKWTTPVIVSVTLPAHAQTSAEIPPEPTEPPCGGNLQVPCDPLPFDPNNEIVTQK